MSELEQVWRERIERQQQSGITVAECCEAKGVSAASFYRWKKLLILDVWGIAVDRTVFPYAENFWCRRDRSEPEP